MGRSGLLDLAAWRERRTPNHWREMLRIEPPSDELAMLRHGTGRGRPLGSDAFLAKLEALVVGRRLRPMAVRRPRRNTPPRGREK